jgi:hypothetical protein
VIVSQPAFDVAVQAHDWLVVTAMVSEPPPGGSETLVVETLYAQDGGVGDEQPHETNAARPSARSSAILRRRLTGRRRVPRAVTAVGRR